jgi:hypothetical protein
MGIRAASEELLLAKTTSGAPGWKSLTKNRPNLHESDIHRHIAILLDKRK